MTSTVSPILDRQWSTLSVSMRAEKLITWSNLLAKNPTFGLMAAKMVRYQCSRAKTLIADIQLMPGPTGETNELYTTARGVFYITWDESASVVGIIGQISAALVAGNSICFGQDNSALSKLIMESLYQATLSKKTVQSVDCLDNKIESIQLAGLCFTGLEAKAIMLNKMLAKRSGLLVQLIVETDQTQLTRIQDPHFIFRFITERTRTINITAVGGNAILLELGNGNH